GGGGGARACGVWTRCGRAANAPEARRRHAPSAVTTLEAGAETVPLDAGGRMTTITTLARLLALPLAAVAFHSSSAPLPAPVQAELRAGYWHAGCPVPLSHLRVLAVTAWGFDGRPHTGRLVVNESAVAPLTTVFRRLYALRFPIRHMQIDEYYGPKAAHPPDGDVTESFECRQAVPSPCTGGTGTGSWSEHAFGEAVDLNPVENPYVGCGR